VRLENCVIQNFDYGVYMRNSNNNQILSNTLIDDVGIILINSDDNTISNNDAGDSNTGFYFDDDSTGNEGDGNTGITIDNGGNSYFYWGPVEAEFEISGSGRFDIKQPGRFILTSDVINLRIVIMASDVTLDCRGHKLESYPTGSSGIWTESSGVLSNIIITNCIVDDTNAESGYAGPGIAVVQGYIVNSTLINNQVINGTFSVLGNNNTIINNKVFGDRSVFKVYGDENTGCGNVANKYSISGSGNANLLEPC